MMITPDPKQVMAMAEYHVETSLAALDLSYARAEAKEELLYGMAKDMEIPRLRDLSAEDVVCGLHSALEVSGKYISEQLRKKDYKLVGRLVEELVAQYIRQDSLVMAAERLERIERETTC